MMKEPSFHLIQSSKSNENDNQEARWLSGRQHGKDTRLIWVKYKEI